MRSTIVLVCLVLAAGVSAAGDSPPIEGKLVRKRGMLGVKTEKGVVRLIPPLNFIGTDVMNQLAAAPNGTYVKIQPKVRSGNDAIPESLLSAREAELDVEVHRKGKKVKSGGRKIRLHSRTRFPGNGGVVLSQAELIQAYAGKEVHASFYALLDAKGQPTDLFLSKVRARVSEATRLAGQPGETDGEPIPAGAYVWVSEAPKGGWQRVSYTYGNTTAGGYVETRLLDTRIGAPPPTESGKPAKTVGLKGGLLEKE